MRVNPGGRDPALNFLEIIFFRNVFNLYPIMGYLEIYYQHIN